MPLSAARQSPATHRTRLARGRSRPQQEHEPCPLSPAYWIGIALVSLAAAGAAILGSLLFFPDTHPDFVRFFFACQYAGLIPVPLPASIHMGGRKTYVDQLHRLLISCRANVAMATKDFFPFLSEAAEGLDLLFCGTPQDYDELAEASIPLSPLGPKELAYIQYTSGSTKFPRGVMITQKAVLNNLAAIVKSGCQVRPDDRGASAAAATRSPVPNSRN